MTVTVTAPGMRVDPGVMPSPVGCTTSVPQRTRVVVETVHPMR
jgi:hypothetical protein